MTNQNLHVDVQETKSISGRFTNMVMSEFNGMIEGGIKFDEEKKRLAQHLFIKADTALKDLESKRSNQNPPIIWQNINLQKMALDATHRIEIGIDALIENHMHIIPYFNKNSGKYDVDLRIGYVGKDFYKRKYSYDEPVDIRYELVYETDTLEVIKKDFSNEIETYNYKVNEPFNRGKIVGGFGYIIFENPKKNKIVLVSETSFLDSKMRAQSDKFWKRDPDQMRWKSLITRVTDKLMIDPKKVSESYFQVEQQEVESDGTKEFALTVATETNSQSVADRFKKQPVAQTQDQPQGEPPPTPDDHISAPQCLEFMVKDKQFHSAIESMITSKEIVHSDLATTDDAKAQEIIERIHVIKGFEDAEKSQKTEEIYF